MSTTHILSSGVAGTMAANGSGLRISTVRNIAAGWVFTLPAAALLSGLLYCLFHAFFISCDSQGARSCPAWPGGFFPVRIGALRLPQANSQPHPVPYRMVR